MRKFLLSLFLNSADLFFSTWYRVESVYFRCIADAALSCQWLIPPLLSVSPFFNLFYFYFSAQQTELVTAVLLTLFPAQPLQRLNPNWNSETPRATSSPDRKHTQYVCTPPDSRACSCIICLDEEEFPHEEELELNPRRL